MESVKEYPNQTASDKDPTNTSSHFVTMRKEENYDGKDAEYYADTNERLQTRIVFLFIFGCLRRKIRRRIKKR